MKTFCTFLMVYLLFLAVQPCHELAKGFSENKDYSVQAETNQQDDAHEGDLCSPFCVCSCCGMTMTTAQANFFQTEEVLSFQTALINQSHRNFYSDSYLKSVWQPPKFNV